MEIVAGYSQGEVFFRIILLWVVLCVVVLYFKGTGF